MQCSICLDDLDASGPTLACGHRFHASCLARLAGANGTTPTRRGALTACPNCRTTSRVAPMTSAAFRCCAYQKKNGKWVIRMFPGREFDDLDELRAAKKQRVEQHIAYSDQNIGRRK